MQVPIRKPGKYTHLKPDPNLTVARFNEMQSKLERLKKISRPQAAAEVKRLAEMGDFSENAAYSMAKGRLRGINQRILDIEEHLKRAIIIQPLGPTGAVQLGSNVTIGINGKQKHYQILGSSETDPTTGIISHNSPIGAALMGKKIGDIVKVKSINNVTEYKIINIR